MSPTAAFAFRFALRDMLVVATGGCDAKSGTVMAEVAPVAFSTPPTAFHPCTSAPAFVTNCPAAFRLKPPSRVYCVFPVEASLMTKKPLP